MQENKIDYQNKTIGQLKHLGHKFLDEYILMDLFRGSIKAEKNHAYRKLSTKVKDGNLVHFGQMKTKEECIEAIKKLRQMIKNRKRKIKWLGKDKVKFAPNIMELQKNVGK